jgi:predicted  nucleic acid-binding Zn-ribbon protein
MQSRDTYIAHMKKQLDELNTKMSTLESKTEQARIEAKDKYKEEMAKLRHQSQLALDKLNELKTASEDSWDTMSHEMEKVRDAFQHSFNYFKAQF